MSPGPLLPPGAVDRILGTRKRDSVHDTPLGKLMAARSAAIAGGLDDAGVRWIDNELRPLLLNTMGDRTRTAYRDTLLRQAYRLFRGFNDQPTVKAFAGYLPQFESTVWKPNRRAPAAGETWSEFRMTLWHARAYGQFPSYQRVTRILSCRREPA